MVPYVYLATRRYEFRSLYYGTILIFLGCKQQSTQYLRFEIELLNTDTIFIIAAVFDTDGSICYGEMALLHYTNRVKYMTLTNSTLQTIFTHNTQM